jgi:cytochrome c oxidase assembly protein subunit 11
MLTPEDAAQSRRRHRFTALAVFSVFVLMIGASYAAVPLYRVFCRATGFGGTPQVATAGSATTGARTLAVRFDANVAPGLPWAFEPETPEMSVKTGTTKTVYFRVRNLAGRDTAANAQYNISPDVGGFYFNKIACFCFSEQHLGPNEVAELPVVFFLDPALEKDPTMNGVDTLTLSYTFFAAKKAPALATSGAAQQGGETPKL